MAKPYSVDLRVRVLADLDSGERPTDLALRYRVSRSWIYRMLKQRRELGHIAPLKGEMGRKPKLKDKDELRRLIAEQPDATLEELREKLDVSVSVSTLCRALNAFKLTLKKSHSRCRTTSSRRG